MLAFPKILTWEKNRLTRWNLLLVISSFLSFFLFVFRQLMLFFYIPLLDIHMLIRN